MNCFKSGRSILLFVTTFMLTSQLQAEHAQLPEITVTEPVHDSFTQAYFDPDANAFSTPDAASALQRMPGGSLNYNGQMSGQMQYRGMFGPRMNSRIDGMYINSGGPNWMDPPLHYLPGALVESIEMQRGIAPVSSGSGIGGYVDARTKSSAFVDSDDFIFSGEMQLGGHSVDGGYDVGGIFATSNRNYRVHLLGSFENGDDLESGDGDITGTEYRRSYAGFGYGYKRGDNEFKLDARHVNSGPIGTPALPLDIRFFDTNLIKSAFSTKAGQFNLKVQVFASNIDHRMSNYQLRPATNIAALPPPFFAGTDERFVDATGDGFGYALTAGTAFMDGDFLFGADGHLARHNATVGDPDVPTFFITNFNDVEVNQHGLFAEWRRDHDKHWGIEAGLRMNVVATDAGMVDATPAILADTGVGLPPVVAAQTLRNFINTAKRSRTDVNLDAVIRFDYTISNQLTAELGFARKVRSPSYIERYLWIPLEINAGLGDANNYIGDPDLVPETSHQVELGLNLQTTDYYFTPRAYYRRVDDYIQGTNIDAHPKDARRTAADVFSTAAAGDDDPLIFSNVDAEFYGFDAGFGYEFNRHWRLDGIMSYTRGKRRDIDDDLFRIAPLNGRLGITYSQSDWSATIEGVAFAEQHDISDELTGDLSGITPGPGGPALKNNNEATAGYALLNFYGQYEMSGYGLNLQAGIENVLDEEYTDHLSGFNRNSASDVPVGQRLPGPGRNIYATLSYRW